MKRYPWHLLTMVVIVGLLLAAAGTVLAQGGDVVEITHPAEGESVSGVIDVTGTVDFPDFMKYELFLKGGGEMIWAVTVYAPVVNGKLATIDTRIYPDGRYQLLVRTVKSDSNYDEYVGANFLIENNLGAPQAYPEIESSPLYAPVAGAVARFVNCSGDNLEVDYHSRAGYCSADDLWIPFKHQNSPTCPYVDVLLIPDCEYEGTARGEGQPEGVGYTFVAETGNVYKVIYPGDRKLYVGEVEPEERAATDTGGVDADDAAHSQPEMAADTSNSADTQQPVQDSDSSAEETQEMLPESGRGYETPASFVAAAVGVILFLLAAGVVALRKRGQPA